MCLALSVIWERMCDNALRYSILHAVLQVEELIQELQGSSPEQKPASSPKSQGKWKLAWSKQVGIFIVPCVPVAHYC